jgi:hypothetical protein
MTVLVSRKATMSTVKGRCSACGVGLELAVAEPFASADLAAALCPASMDQQFLASGAAIVELRQDLENALFPLGKVTITGGAVDALPDAGEHAATFLVRHVRGDWGEHGTKYSSSPSVTSPSKDQPIPRPLPCESNQRIRPV